MSKVLLLSNEAPSCVAVLIEQIACGGFQAVHGESILCWTRRRQELEDGLVVLSQRHPLDYRETCRSIRKTSDIPILVLSVNSEVADLVAALELGADDYMAVPYERLAFVARMKALARRSSLTRNGRPGMPSIDLGDPIEIGTLRVDCNYRDAFVKERPVGLTNIEFRLLYHFLSNPGVLLPKERIFLTIWGYDIETNTHSLSTYVHRMKKKLRVHGVWLPLESHPRVGYMLTTANEAALFPTAVGAGVWLRRIC